MQNLPGVSHHTGGRRILIRACIGLRSGKVGNRSPYRARIEDGPNLKKGVPEGSYFLGFYGVKSDSDFSGKPGNILENFFKIFFKKNFRIFFKKKIAIAI